MSFLYNDSTPYGIAHNNDYLELLTREGQESQIVVESKVFYDKTIILPKNSKSFILAGRTNRAEMAYMGTQRALEYEGVFPSYAPHTRRYEISRLAFTAPNGAGPKIYGGGKFLHLNDILVHSCKDTPIHIEAFDSGSINQLYILENHSPAIFNNVHATHFYDLKIRENFNQGAQFSNMMNCTLDMTIESNRGLGLRCDNVKRCDVDVWYEANNFIVLPDGSKRGRFHAEWYDSPFNTFRGNHTRDQNFVYYDEITAATSGFDIFHNIDWGRWIPILDNSFVIKVINYVNVTSPTPNSLLVAKDGYANEIDLNTKNCELQFISTEVQNFAAKKGQYFLLDFDIKVSPEVAAYLANKVRTAFTPIPFYYMSFAGGTIAASSFPFVTLPGYTKFRLIGKAGADFTGIKLYIKPIQWTVPGPDIPLDFSIENLSMYYTNPPI